MSKLDDVLNNLATLSEILVEVSKSHITPSKAIDDIRKLDIGAMYELMSKQIELLGLYKNYRLEVIEYFQTHNTGKMIDYAIAIYNLEKEIEEMKW